MMRRSQWERWMRLLIGVLLAPLACSAPDNRQCGGCVSHGAYESGETIYVPPSDSLRGSVQLDRSDGETIAAPSASYDLQSSSAGAHLALFHTPELADAASADVAVDADASVRSPLLAAWIQWTAAGMAMGADSATIAISVDAYSCAPADTVVSADAPFGTPDDLTQAFACQSADGERRSPALHQGALGTFLPRAPGSYDVTASGEGIAIDVQVRHDAGGESSQPGRCVD